MEDASHLKEPLPRPGLRPAVLYWVPVVAMTAALCALDAHPVKPAGLAIAALAVWRYGLSLFGPYLVLALVTPEAGGDFPAILSLPDLLFLPLLLRFAITPGARKIFSPVTVAVLALAAAGATALIVGVCVRGAALRPAVFTAYQHVGHMAAFAVAASIARERAGAKALLGWIMAGACTSALAGIAQVLGGDAFIDLQGRIARIFGYPAYDLAHVERYLWWGVRKAFAGYYSPNGLGAALMFGLMLTTGRLLRAPTWLGMGAAVLLGAGLVASFSRGALLAASSTFLLLAWERTREARFATAAPLAASALILPALYGVLLHGSTAAAPVSEALRGGGGLEAAAPLKRRSAEMKLEEARNVAAMWRKGIGLFGAGYGVSYRAGEGFVREPHAIEISPAYAEILYRSGIVGALALACAALSLRKSWRGRGPMAAHGHPVQPALFGALVHSAVDHPFLTVPGLVAVFWASWGLLEASGDSQGDEKSSRPARAERASPKGRESSHGTES